MGGDVEAPPEPAWIPAFARRVLEESSRVVFLHGSVDGSLAAVGAGAAHTIGRPAEGLTGMPIGALVAEHDRPRLLRMISGDDPVPAGSFRLNFVDAAASPHTFDCRLRVAGGEFVLFGEPDEGPARELQDRLIEAHNELATTTRELARGNRELQETRARLEATLGELNSSYWHLRRIQEVLPICLDCGKVKSGESGWQEIVAYLKENAPFLSHGYCPDCAGRLLDTLED